MSKKKEDLEAIVDLLHEWAEEYGEDYVVAAIVDSMSGCLAGTANICIAGPDYELTRIYREYPECKEKEPDGGNRTGSGT